MAALRRGRSRRRGTGIRAGEHRLSHHLLPLPGGAEKLLKAYLIAQGWTLERTHDVVALLELCAAYDANWRDLVDEGAVLNEYIVSGRYPGDLAFEGIGHPEVEESLQAVRRIHARITMLLKTSP